MSPEDMHHSQWILKVIYSLKVWMFRAQFKITPREEKSLRNVCVSLLCMYIYIYQSMVYSPAVSAPHNDLLLMKSLT